MKNKKIICKNCGEEISNPKAEICVKCGVRVRQNKVVKGFVILFGIVVVILGGIFGKIFITKLIDESRRKSYVGTWELQTDETLVSYEEKHLNFITKDENGNKVENYDIVKREIIIDKVLEITDENVYYGISLSGCGPDEDDKDGRLEERCPTVPPIVGLNKNDKIVAIDFITPYGDGPLLCFKRNGDIITQIKCGTANADELNPAGLYTMNGGVNEELNIIYKKIK